MSVQTIPLLLPSNSMAHNILSQDSLFSFGGTNSSFHLCILVCIRLVFGVCALKIASLT
uniref:Uncharacterized protein n=1 Tax=Arundo donax TaxID=35708 RepID=A0A0A9FE77_ARUDO